MPDIRIDINNFRMISQGSDLPAAALQIKADAPCFRPSSSNQILLILFTFNRPHVSYVVKAREDDYL